MTALKAKLSAITICTMWSGAHFQMSMTK